MHLDSAARRSAETPRRRGSCQPTRQTTTNSSAPVERRTAVTRSSRLDDAIVSQWLLDQVPSDHRHARQALA
jgi:hypothetical protein